MLCVSNDNENEIESLYIVVLYLNSTKNEGKIISLCFVNDSIEEEEEENTLSIQHTYINISIKIYRNVIVDCSAFGYQFDMIQIGALLSLLPT